MKPVIVIVGNCQSSFVANFLMSIPEIAGTYTVRRFRNYRADLDEEGGQNEQASNLPEFLNNNRGNIVAFLRQATHNWVGDPITAADFGPEIDYISYPVCLLNFLWPLTTRDDRMAALPAGLRQRFPYSLHDQLLAKLVQDGVPENEIVDAYMSHDIGKMFNLDRLRRLNTIKMKQIDALASFPMWDYIDSNIGETQLFRTMNHPSGRLMAVLLRQIVERLRVITDRTTIEQRLEDIATGPGIQDFDAPIHPAIVRHFGIKWAERDRYQFWDEGEYSFEEHLVRLYHLRSNLTYQEADRALRAGELDSACRIMERAVADVPRSIAFKIRLSDVYFRQKKFSQAAEQARQAWEIAEATRIDQKIIRALLRSGLRTEAAAAVNKMAADLGECSETILARATILINQRKLDEAVELLKAAAAQRPNYRFWLVIGNTLAAMGNRDAAVQALETAYRLSGMTPAVGKRLEAMRNQAADVGVSDTV